MIDIHCHILNGADDGSADKFDSAEMLRIAAESGITDIIATPHCYPGIYNNFNGMTLNAKFDRFISEHRESETGVRIHRGMEVYADDDVIHRADEGRLMTLANSSYMLIECAFNENPDFMTAVLHELLKRRIHPVIAHPERYYFIRNKPEIALGWVDMGCSLQLNAGSIMGQFGSECRRIAHDLLSSGAVQLIASDAHGAIKRTPELQSAFELVGVQFSFDFANTLLTENPARIIDNRRLRFPELKFMSQSREEFLSDEEYWGI